MIRRCCWSIVALLAVVGSLRADIPPGPSPRHDPAPLLPLPEQFAKPATAPARVVIFLNEDWDKRLPAEDAGQPRLRFPTRMLAQQNVAMAALGDQRRAEGSLPRSVVLEVGMALTMSLALSALCLARGKNRRWWLGCALLMAAVVVGGASGCPGLDSHVHDTPEKLGGMQPGIEGSPFGKAQVLLERDDAIDTIQLVIDRGELTKLVNDSSNKP